MHRPRLHKLPVPTPQGTPQTATVAVPSTPAQAAAVAPLLNTSTAATGRGNDATRGTHMGAPRNTAGRSDHPGETTGNGRTIALRPAVPLRRIGITEVQIEWAHNDPLRPTLGDLHRVMLAAERAGDTARVERYRLVTRAYVARELKAAL